VKLKQLAPETVKVKSISGCLSLHLCCGYGASSEVIKLILEAYPEEVQDKDGELVLHLLCRSNSPSPDVIRMVIEGDPKATEVQDNYGMLPLHLTCYHMAPIDIERLLVGAFPEGISKITLASFL
jgi:ankyrin repeat protein